MNTRIFHIESEEVDGSFYFRAFDNSPGCTDIDTISDLRAFAERLHIQEDAKEKVQDAAEKAQSRAEARE